MVLCNGLSPQIFWFKRARTSMAVHFVVSIFVNVGMWFERFVIIVTSLARDFLPSSWGYYSPSVVEIFILRILVWPAAQCQPGLSPPGNA